MYFSNNPSSYLMSFTHAEILSLEKFLWVAKNQNQYEKRGIQKVQKYCSVFRYIPGLLLVWVGNSMAMNTANKNSDIDVFIITRKNALWFVRVIMTFIVMITGNRKTSKKHAGRICLSFFCTEDVLDFSNIAFDRDIYLYYWILTMKPILTRWDIYEKFMRSNSWVDFWYNKNIHKHYNNFLKYKITKGRETNSLIKYTDNLFEKLLSGRSLKKYETLWQPEWIIINDDMLKFHNNDRRKYIRKKVLEKS